MQNMELRLLGQKEDKTASLFASADCQALLQIYDTYYPKIGFHVPWVAYLIIRQNQVVGSCSFTGKPVNGTVELAYWTFHEFEGQGVASFACSELIKIARRADPGVIITAKTAPTQNASTRILAKNHFTFTEVVQDHEIGDAWLWTLAADTRTNPQ